MIPPQLAVTAKMDCNVLLLGMRVLRSTSCEKCGFIYRTCTFRVVLWSCVESVYVQRAKKVLPCLLNQDLSVVLPGSVTMDREW